MNPPVTDMQLLGQLLRCPSGIYAKEVGEYTFFSNRTMIFNTIDCLSLLPNSNVLEIGFGNASHLPYLFEKEPTIHYTGEETSVEMITESIHFTFSKALLAIIAIFVSCSSLWER